MCLCTEEGKGEDYWVFGSLFLKDIAITQLLFPVQLCHSVHADRSLLIHCMPFSPFFWCKHVCIYMLCFPASSSQPLPSLPPTRYKNLPGIQLVKGEFFLPSGCSVAQILLACLHTLAGAIRPPLSPSSFSPPPTSWQ